MHFQTCQYLPCNCKVCGAEVKITEIAAHVEEHHPYCQYCNQRMRRADDDYHAPRKCLADKCKMEVPRCILREHFEDCKYGAVHAEFLVARRKRAIAYSKQVDTENAKLRSQIVQIKREI